MTTSQLSQNIWTELEFEGLAWDYLSRYTLSSTFWEVESSISIK
jgi:hypothetical protein